jgi:DNA-binding response OmpR family regulator
MELEIMQHISRDSILVMIVEDEFIPAQYLKSIIEEQEDFVVMSIASSADEAWQSIHDHQPVIVFMDIMLEGSMSGAELALQIHRRYQEILIIFITAYSSEEMVSYAVESSAFAYLLKPYRPEEIKATLQLAKARLEFGVDQENPERIALVDGFFYDKRSQRLYLDRQEIALSSSELKLIQILCREHHAVVEKERLLAEMKITDDSLRSLIYRIRKHISGSLIESVKRYGYRIALK